MVLSSSNSEMLLPSRLQQDFERRDRSELIKQRVWAHQPGSMMASQNFFFFFLKSFSWDIFLNVWSEPWEWPFHWKMPLQGICPKGGPLPVSAAPKGGPLGRRQFVRFVKDSFKELWWIREGFPWGFPQGLPDEIWRIREGFPWGICERFPPGICEGFVKDFFKEVWKIRAGFHLGFPQRVPKELWRIRESFP